jgi:hypothetical protein
MHINKLSAEETRESGFTHKIEITHADLTAAAVTETLTVLSGLTLGWLVRGAAFRLVEGFVGTDVTSLKLDVGWNGATTDDPDGLLDNYEIATAGTEILAGDGNGAAFATLRTGFCPLEATSIEALFTATGANVSVLTAGEVHIYLAASDLSKL